MRTIIDVDDDLLAQAQEELGTATKRDTVNEALRFVAGRKRRVEELMSDRYFLGGPDLDNPEVMAKARR
jgi:Arc/MetJ family transcription regulator